MNIVMSYVIITCIILVRLYDFVEITGRDYITCYGLCPFIDSLIPEKNIILVDTTDKSVNHWTILIISLDLFEI